MRKTRRRVPVTETESSSTEETPPPRTKHTKKRGNNSSDKFIKKPQTPFFRFMFEKMDRFKQKYPGEKRSQLVSRIGKLWRNLSE